MVLTNLSIRTVMLLMLKGNVGVRNGFKTPKEIDDNAKRYIEGFNKGEPTYFVSTGCDAQQLFGQNWAHQLG